MLPASSATTLAEKARTLAEETAQGGALYVLDVVIKGGHGGPNVEVVVDTDAGVTVDELAGFSRELGFAFDTADLVAGHYTLTVTSPGATKPLTAPRQYPRHVGRTLDVALRPEHTAALPEHLAGATAVAGVLTAVDLAAGTLTLAVAGKGKKDAPVPVTLAFDEIDEARVKLPW